MDEKSNGSGGAQQALAPSDVQVQFSNVAPGMMQIQFALGGQAAFALVLPHAMARGVVKAWTEQLDLVEGGAGLVQVVPAGAIPRGRG